jgi:hypothetical protein
VIPPPPDLRVRQKLYFDAGASEWNHGNTGSSLKYFHDMWLRYGHVFNEIFAYERGTTAEDFYKQVPENLRDHVHYQQCSVVSSPEEEVPDEKPFLPSVIKKEATAADYVLFKLDIDEIAFEHHGKYLMDLATLMLFLHASASHIQYSITAVGGNYLMEEWHVSNKFSIKDSYDLFLKMRQKGIRSHSWI